MQSKSTREALPLTSKPAAQDANFKDQCMKLEQRMMELERKNSNLIAKSKDTKRQMDKKEKESAALQLRVDKLTELLRAAELGRKVSEEYARKLEVKFERSGRGIALLKAARLQAELEAAQQQNQKLADVIGCKNKDTDNLAVTIANLEYTLGRAAQGMGLPDGQALTEFLELRDRVQAVEQELAEKETTLTSLMDEFAVAETRLKQLAQTEHELATLRSTVDTQQKAIAEMADDKSTLLDYVQELQDERDKLLAETEDAHALAKQAKREAEQAVAHSEASSEQQQKWQARVDELQHAISCSGIAEVQRKLAAAEALCEQREADLQEQHHSHAAAQEAMQGRLHGKELQFVEVAVQRDNLQKKVIELEAIRQRMELSWQDQQKHNGEQQQQAAALQTRIQVLEMESRRMEAELQDKDALWQRTKDLESKEAALLKLVDDLRAALASMERQVQVKEAEREADELLCGDLVHAIRLHRASSAPSSSAPAHCTPARVRLSKVGTEVRLLLEDLGRAGQQIQLGRDLQDEVARQAEEARAEVAEMVRHISSSEAEKQHLLAELEVTKGEMEELRLDNASVLKQMEDQLRTLCEIESLMPPAATAAAKGSSSLAQQLVAQVRQHVQEAAAIKEQHEQLLQQSAHAAQQLDAARDELRGLELVVKPAKQMLQERLHHASAMVTQLQEERDTLAGELLLEKERSKKFELDSKARLHAVESAAAHSTAKRSASSSQAEEQLAGERDHSRALQLEVHRLELLLEERERDLRRAQDTAKQAGAELHRDRQSQVRELKASLKARQPQAPPEDPEAHQQDWTRQQEPRDHPKEPVEPPSAPQDSRPPPVAALKPAPSRRESDTAQLIRAITLDLDSSSSDEEDAGPQGTGRTMHSGRPAARQFAPQASQHQRPGSSAAAAADDDGPGKPGTRATDNSVNRGLAAACARSFRQAPGGSRSSQTEDDSNLQAPVPSSSGTDEASGHGDPRHGLRHWATQPHNPSKAPPHVAAARMLHQSATAGAVREPAAAAAAGGRPSSASTPISRQDSRGVSSGRQPGAAASRSPTSSALLQQLQELHVSHRELRNKFQRALSISGERRTMT